jgi:hypothetical protein
MFMIMKLDDVPIELSKVYSNRLQSRGEIAAHTVRGPAGLFLIREDGAAGSKLAKEVVGSFKYWDLRSERFFDGVFLGWGYDAGGDPNPGERAVCFNNEAFVQCIKDLEEKLVWQHLGRAQLLLTDFVYDMTTRKGALDFSRTIPLDLSRLLDEKKLRQLSPLIEELVAPARSRSGSDAETSVWDISDYIAVLRTRRFFWKAFIKKIGFLLGWADEIAPYAVKDLRKSKKDCWPG